MVEENKGAPKIYLRNSLFLKMTYERIPMPIDLFDYLIN